MEAQVRNQAKIKIKTQIFQYFSPFCGQPLTGEHPLGSEMNEKILKA